jgi:hypothetical protein
MYKIYDYDNGALGLLLDNWYHVYESDITSLVNDIKSFFDNRDVSDWEGNELEECVDHLHLLADYDLLDSDLIELLENGDSGAAYDLAEGLKKENFLMVYKVQK